MPTIKEIADKHGLTRQWAANRAAKLKLGRLVSRKGKPPIRTLTEREAAKIRPGKAGRPRKDRP